MCRQGHAREQPAIQEDMGSPCRTLGLGGLGTAKTEATNCSPDSVSPGRSAEVPSSETKSPTNSHIAVPQ